MRNRLRTHHAGGLRGARHAYPGRGEHWPHGGRDGGLWRTPDAVVSRIKIVDGWDAILAAHEARRGVVFLSPHMATFEVVLFLHRPANAADCDVPPTAWRAEPMMRAGRDRMQIKSEPAEMSGIRAMLKALRRGDAIGLLPDQVPDPAKGGEGVWALPFGRPGLHHDAGAKAAKTTGALVVMTGCRSACATLRAIGWSSPLAPFSDDAVAAATELNAAVEAAIALAPEQFL